MDRAKTKAKELVYKFHGLIYDCVGESPTPLSKSCALITVNELLRDAGSINFDFWSSVKAEIIKL